MIVDSALYVDGLRLSEEASLTSIETEHLEDGAFAWIGLAEPTVSEIERVVGSFRLHVTAIEDAVSAQQRARIEENGEITTFVIRTVFYDDNQSSISTGELICFIHKRFIIISRHGSGSQLVSVRSELEARPGFLNHGPYAVLHGVLEKVIDEYTKIIAEIEKDVVQIENEVFSDSRISISRKIYSLKRELIEYRHAVDPLLAPLHRILSEARESFPEALKPYFRDVSDQLTRASEQGAALDSLLSAALQADLAQVQVQQNHDVRRISAWVALAALPTMVAGIYGMNFEFMPELKWKFGYLTVMALTFACCAYLFRKLKKAQWL